MAGGSKKPGNRKKTGMRGGPPETLFRPGQSGNPGGRPAKSPELRRIEDLAQTHSEVAMLALVDEAKNGKGAPRVAAAQAILDRGWGKVVERTVNDNHTTIEDRRVQGADEILARAFTEGPDR